MTGLGQYIDMALLDVQIATMANQGMNYLSSGNIPKRYGNAHANIVPYQVFKASDRDFIIACGNDTQFIQLCHSIGLPIYRMMHVLPEMQIESNTVRKLSGFYQNTFN